MSSNLRMTSSCNSVTALINEATLTMRPMHGKVINSGNTLSNKRKLEILLFFCKEYFIKIHINDIISNNIYVFCTNL
jgi:hypothetical protein